MRPMAGRRHGLGGLPDTNARHQPFVDLPNQAQRKRELVDSLEAVSQGCVRVRDLPHVDTARALLHLRFVPEKVHERRLRALDLTPAYSRRTRIPENVRLGRG